MSNYSARIQSHLPTKKVYKIITEEMANWWTPMSSKFLALGDFAKTEFGGESYWVFEATVLNEYHLIELTCCEANHVHNGLSENIRQEWLNTILQFQISEERNITSIKFTHKGLLPELECFEVCKNGWDYFFLKSLKKYLDSSST